MNGKKFASVAVVLCGMAFVGARAIAEPKGSKEAHGHAASGQPEMKLPPGWTAEDMKACMDAATPGKMHEHLAHCVGTWSGKNTMWMAPDTDPIKSESTSTFTAMMDGKFVKMETAGMMPGMGPFNGFGLYGFDNVSQKFQSTWVDNMGTGMMTGTGELTSDGKTMTWKYDYNCPVSKKPVTMREIEKITGPNSRTIEMYAIDPKSGKEYKMMVIEMTRNGSSTDTAEVPTGNK